jgi:hypothetical protein
MASRVRLLPLRHVDARSRSLVAAGPFVLLAVALMLFGWFTLTAIDRPGLQYDEALFVNGALGGHYANGSFVSARFHGLITMLMPYIGALKAWLYAPIFEVFGVTVTSIRLPVIVICGITIAIAFLMARRLFGPWPAALLALLMATDPALLAMGKTDYGPIVLSALLRVTALAAYLSWRRTCSTRYLWLLVGSALLGIFNKVDYLAFLVGLAFAAVVVDHRGIVRRLRARPVIAAAAAGVLVAGLAVEYAQIVAPARRFPAVRSDAGLAGRVHEVWDLFRSTMDGVGFFQYMSGVPFDHRSGIAAATVVVVILAAALVAWRVAVRVRLAPSDEPLAAAADDTALFLLLLVGVGGALVLTPQAVGPHHAMLLWPLPALLGISLLSAAWRLPHPQLRVGATTLLLIGALWLLGTQLGVDRAYRAAFRSDRAWAPGWTTEIYPVANAVDRIASGADGIVVADWGIGNQLLALGNDAVRSRVNDAWGSFAAADQGAIEQIAAGMRGRRTIVLMHAPGAEIMPGTTTQAQAMLGRIRARRGAKVAYRGEALLVDVVDDRPR